MTRKQAEARVVKMANRMVTPKGWLIDAEHNISIKTFLRRRIQFEVAVLEYRAALARKEKK